MTQHDKVNWLQELVRHAPVKTGHGFIVGQRVMWWDVPAIVIGFTTKRVRIIPLRVNTPAEGKQLLAWRTVEPSSLQETEARS